MSLPLLSILLIVPLSAADWPQWRGGPSRSGHAAEATVLSRLAGGAALIEAWHSEELPNGYGHQNACVVGQGSPVVADGRVYLYVNRPDPTSVKVESNGCRIPARVHDTVLCLDLASGATRWSVDLPGHAWRWGCSVTLAVGQGRVLAVGTLGEGFCLDAADGTLMWRWAAPEAKRPATDTYTDLICPSQGSALIFRDRAVCLGAGHLAVCDLADGRVLWNVAHGGKQQPWSSPTAWPHTEGWTLLAANTAWDPVRGEPRWKGLAHGWSTPAVEGDLCAVMGGKGLTISRLTTQGPQLLAERVLDNGGGNAAIHQGLVYACGKSSPGPGPDGKPAPAVGTVVCLEAATGAVRWQTAEPTLAVGGQWSFVSVVVGDGVVAVLSNTSLWLYDVRDGRRRRDPLTLDNLKGGTSCAIVGDRIITRGTKAVRCYRAGETP